jgi:hypothetical protein
MRPGLHRYDPRLRPVGHRQARTPLWIPLWLPALLVILGAPLVVLAVFPASGVPGRLSTPRPTSTGIADPPLAPAAGNPAEATPSPLSLPVPTSPPPKVVVPGPTPSPSGPGCGRKPPHPSRSPRVVAQR